MNRLPVPLADCHAHLGGLGAIADMAAIMAAREIEAVNVLSLARWRPDYLDQNVLILLCKLLFPGRIYAFGAPAHPAATAGPWDPAGQACALVGLGCDGIKMLDGKPELRKESGWPLDAPVYDELFGYLAAEGIPVLYHVADPETFWDPAAIPAWARDRGWSYADGTYPAKEDFYREIDGILRRFPGLKLILAHFYFLSADADRAAAFLDAWPDVHLDLTPGMEMYVNFGRRPGAWREFFLAYQDRILFGTDNGDLEPDRRTWVPRLEAIRFACDKIDLMKRFLLTQEEFDFWGERVRGIGLDEEALAKICRDNFRRLTGPTPRPVDRGAVAAECARLAAAVGDDPSRLELRSRLAEMAALIEMATG